MQGLCEAGWEKALLSVTNFDDQFCCRNLAMNSAMDLGDEFLR